MMLSNNIDKSNIFIVGTGGIGCELLKTLVLAGFKNIQMIDLDTIELSNLNRQFLFHKKHVGLSKALVAKESMLNYRPNLNLTSYHDSITDPKFDIDFFRQFDLVFSALDNNNIRYHLNRMCLAADVPLIESGTTGYLGQVKPIFKGKTECFDCLSRPEKQQYATCTIRNTPSEPVHCIVWAKNLFNVLFGEPNSEGVEDSVAPESNTQSTDQSSHENDNTTQKHVSIYEWAHLHNFSVRDIGKKLFIDDINYLLTMSDLWKTRKPPHPLDHFESILNNHKQMTLDTNSEMEQRRVWTLEKCVHYFATSLTKLYKNYTNNKTLNISKHLNSESYNYLTWDKDDVEIMTFVAAAANIRSYIFGIPLQSFFDVKSIAGNIIPAIATTNAIVAGLIVIQACFILNNKSNLNKNVFIRNTPLTSNINTTNKVNNPTSSKTNVIINKPRFRTNLLGKEEFRPPNPKCFSCSISETQATIVCDVTRFCLAKLVGILNNNFSMLVPDITVDNGLGTLLYSAESPPSQEQINQPLQTFNSDLVNARLICEDFETGKKCVIWLKHQQNYPEHHLTIVETAKTLSVADNIPSSSSAASTENGLPHKGLKRTHSDEDSGDSQDPKNGSVQRIEVEKLKIDEIPSKKMRNASGDSKKISNNAYIDEDLVILDDINEVPSTSHFLPLRTKSHKQNFEKNNLEDDQLIVID